MVTLIWLSFPQGPLVRWLKVNFSEAFIAWIHIKALRVFVESVLRCNNPTSTLVTGLGVKCSRCWCLQSWNDEARVLCVFFVVICPEMISLCLRVTWSSFRYGLPVNFQAMLLQPSKKTMKKLREVLNDLYKHLDSSAAAIIDVSG